MKNLLILIGILLIIVIALPFVLIALVGVGGTIYALWIGCWEALFSVFS